MDAEATHCTKCGGEIAPKFLFCPFCGTPRGAPARAPGTEKRISRKAADALNAFDKQFEALKKKIETTPKRVRWSAGPWYYILFAVITVVTFALLFYTYRSLLPKLPPDGY